MNAWEIAAGLLLLAGACSFRQQSLLQRDDYRRTRKTWRTIAWGTAAWLYMVAAGGVLIYGGLPSACKGGACAWERLDPAPETQEPPLAK